MRFEDREEPAIFPTSFPARGELGLQERAHRALGRVFILAERQNGHGDLATIHFTVYPADAAAAMVFDDVPSGSPVDSDLKYPTRCSIEDFLPTVPPVRQRICRVLAGNVEIAASASSFEAPVVPPRDEILALAGAAIARLERIRSGLAPRPMPVRPQLPKANSY